MQHDPVDNVHALVTPAMQALACGTFAHLAPSLREAIAACSPQQRLALELPGHLVQALLVPVLERLTPEEVRRHLGPLDELDAQRLAEFWAAICSGEIAFDG